MEPWPTCSDPATSSANGVTALLEGKIVRGTQKFAGASGKPEGHEPCRPSFLRRGRLPGAATDTWTGTLVIPGMEFDLTPPVLKGAAPKSVTAPRNAKFVRVRYSVKAQDAVDRSRARAVQAGLR